MDEDCQNSSLRVVSKVEVEFDLENDSNSVTTRDILRVGAEFDSYEQLCTAITN